MVIFSLYEYVTSKLTVSSHTGCNEVTHWWTILITGSCVLNIQAKYNLGNKHITIFFGNGASSLLLKKTQRSNGKFQYSGLIPFLRCVCRVLLQRQCTVRLTGHRGRISHLVSSRASFGHFGDNWNVISLYLSPQAFPSYFHSLLRRRMRVAG